MAAKWTYRLEYHLGDRAFSLFDGDDRAAVGLTLADAKAACVALNSHAALLEALKEAQSVLAMMVEPGAIQQTTTLNAYAAAKAAEAKARAAISQAEGGE